MPPVGEITEKTDEDSGVQIGFELRKHAEHVESAERALAVRTIVPRGNL